MSLNGNTPIIPPGALTDDADVAEQNDVVPTREVDGEEVLDDEVDPAQVSSIDADRAATQADEA